MRSGTDLTESVSVRFPTYFSFSPAVPLKEHAKDAQNT